MLNESIYITTFYVFIDYTITKLPESSDLYDDITEFGVAEGDPPPPQTKRYYHTDLQMKFVFYIYPTV